MTFMEELLKQHQQIDSLTSRVERLLKKRRATVREGDRVEYRYIESVEFRQQDNTARDIVFAIPEGTDFVAQRFALFPFARFVTPTPAVNGEDELVFRPCIYPFFEGAYQQAGYARFEYDAASVDCFLQFSENYMVDGKQRSRSYQNMPFPVELAYSGAVNYKPTAFTQVNASQGYLSFDRYYNDFQFPSAMLFPTDWYLPGGSDFQIKIAPSFASVRDDPGSPSGDPTLQNEYKLVAVLEGYKVIR